MMESPSSPIVVGPSLPDMATESSSAASLSTSTSPQTDLGSTSYFVWWKVLLLLWDLTGLITNGLGVDMLWHGVEVNHAVYALVLQDIGLCWASSLASWIFTWLFWGPGQDESWLTLYILCAAVPLTFHDWAWSSVAYLRSINITDNDSWLELDQEALRIKMSWVTWLETSLHLLIVGLTLHFTAFSAPVNTPAALPESVELNGQSDSSDLFYLGMVVVFATTAMSYLVALFYYLKILKFARQEAAERKAAIQAAEAAAASAASGAAAAAAENGSAQQQAANPVQPVQQQQQHVGAIFDDSDDDDDDLLDASESPNAKQESAVCLALKTMLAVAVTRFIALTLLACTDQLLLPGQASAKNKLAAVAAILCLTRHPCILAISVFNFGPIRNTVAIYAENLPDHLAGVLDPAMDWVHASLRLVSSRDDQRSIVEASHDEHNVNYNNASPTNPREARPNLVGQRDSAVSPADSNDSLNELPAVQC